MVTKSFAKGPVLVGVDGEGQAEAAVHAAVRLAGALQLRLELVHAAKVSDHLWHHVGEDELAVARTRTLARLRERLDEAGLAGEDLSDHLSVLPGPPAKALLERAKQLGAGLIVLGPHVKHGLLDLDNTVRAVLAHANCPVWVQPSELREIRRILCAHDMSEESRGALELARILARTFRAKLCVLHCFVRPELGFVLGYPIPFPTSVVDNARETAQAEFEASLAAMDWSGLEHESVFVEAEPASEVLERHREFDLVVMGTHGRTGLSGAILGSVANSVLRAAERPVLAVRSKGRAWLA
jgi:nucleotide-binding universal stress UspA family protein